jgi:NDP-sugar pyrophosphorylase family protein
MQAIILAGGKGSRLKPFTTCIPKPLVPLGDTPILEVVLRQLQHHGFNDVVLAVNHFAELIIAFFGNGQKLNLNIFYSIEDEPLGTAGPLTLVNNLDDNFLVMNGDLLTTVNYKNLFNYHLRNKNDITIATHQKEVNIDLGVLEIKKDNFMRYIEKPTYRFDVSTGIYIFNKDVLGLIPKNKKMDMPSFISKAKRCGKKIKCYRRNYYWLDIGRPDDYEKAVEVFEEKKEIFLP